MALGFDPASFALAFAAGFVSCISPCVLPLVPGYLSFTSGVGVGQLAERRSAVLVAVGLFFAGFAATFTLMGSGAGALGDLLLTNRRPLEVVAGIFLVLMAVVLTGVRLPVRVLREVRIRVAPPTRAAGRVLTGVAFAIGWTPCIGPTLAAVLTLAAAGQDPVLGAALLFTYALGLGVPFLLAALFFTRALGAVGALRRHQRAVALASATVLAGFGLLLASGELTRFTFRFVGLAPFGV